MAELPFMILMLEVVSRLPAKCACQCKLVCTEWSTFISTKEFAKVHMAKSNDFMFLSTVSRDNSFLTVRFLSSMFSYDDPVYIPFNIQRPWELKVLATLDGLLCFPLLHTCEIVIWNPLTSAYKKLPKTNNQGFYKVDADALGFYAHGSHGYSVLHVTRRQQTYAFYVYSMSTDTWREIYFSMAMEYHTCRFFWSCATLCGDMLFFMVSDSWRLYRETIIRFDVNSEQFLKISIPDVTYEGGYQLHIVNVHNEIRLFVMHGINEYAIDLWKMMGDEWCMVDSLSNVMPIRLTEQFFIKYVVSEDKWLLMTDNDDVYVLDLNTNKVSYNFIWKYFSAIQGATYNGTLISPNM